MPPKRSFRKGAKKQAGRQLGKIVEVIGLVDGVRHGRPTDIEAFLRKVKGTGVIGGKLRVVRRDINKILMVTRSSRSLHIMRTIVTWLNILLIPCFSLVFASIIMVWYKLTPGPFAPLLSIVFSPYYILPISILGVVFLLLRWALKQKLESIYSTLSGRMREKRRLKSLAQGYIDLLGKKIKEYNVKPERFKFKLYHNDYKNVKYIGKPGILSEFYVGVVEAKEKSSV